MQAHQAGAGNQDQQQAHDAQGEQAGKGHLAGNGSQTQVKQAEGGGKGQITQCQIKHVRQPGAGKAGGIGDAVAIAGTAEAGVCRRIADQGNEQENGGEKIEHEQAVAKHARHGGVVFCIAGHLLFIVRMPGLMRNAGGKNSIILPASKQKENPMPDFQHHRLIIMGSGPAGYTAALYAARANLDPVVITGMEQGGQLTTTTDVDNWPGDVAGLQGPDLMDRMRRHVERFDASVIFDHINAVELGQRPFRLQGETGAYSCDALIIATRRLGALSGPAF